MSDVDRVVAQLFVCPACGSGVELGVAGLACASCPVVLPITQGWCLDAVIDEEQLDDGKKRFVGYEKPAAAALYDLDVRVTSNTLWRAPLARQVDFNRAALQAAAEARSAYLDVPVGTGLVSSAHWKELRHHIPSSWSTSASRCFDARGRGWGTERSMCEPTSSGCRSPPAPSESLTPATGSTSSPTLQLPPTRSGA